MPRPTSLVPALVVALLLVCPVGAQASDRHGRSGGHLIALLGNTPIELEKVSAFHCHDLDLPTIRCFGTEAERDAATPQVASEGGDARALLLAYVLWYEHIDYLGASYLASSPISDLGSIGWNNAISSFKSTNGGRPKWWDGTGYSSWSWQWATGAWVSNVGAANDSFSSVQNVP